MKLLISDNGVVAGMYSDRLIPVMERLGEAQVNRASNVEWNNGKWEARSSKDDSLLAAAKTREEALRLEHVAVENNLGNYV